MRLNQIHAFGPASAGSTWALIPISIARLAARPVCVARRRSGPGVGFGVNDQQCLATGSPLLRVGGRLRRTIGEGSSGEPQTYGEAPRKEPMPRASGTRPHSLLPATSGQDARWFRAPLSICATRRRIHRNGGFANLSADYRADAQNPHSYR
jgi:hypothetical protein